MSDLRFALRSLSKSPGFAAVAILTLALGIGFSTSSFSIANAFLLRNVPYPNADRLVTIFGTTRDSQTASHTPANLIELRETATSFADFVIYNQDTRAFGEPGEPPEQVYGIAVTANFFDLIGVHPVIGRGFTADEDQPDKPAVLVITHRVWTNRYASNPNIVGHIVRINSELHTIVGVLPPAFDAPLVWGTPEFIVPRPLLSRFRTERTVMWMSAVARLKPGVSPSQAQTELSVIASRQEREYPKENAGRGLRVADFSHANMGSIARTLLWLMTGIALAMLLIACANLASLQVVSAFRRSREFAVRAALGGSRRQLMMPLLLESLTLALLGGIGGLFIASWSNNYFGSQFALPIPIDVRVLAFAAFSSLLSGLAFGLAPAWLAARSSAAETLKEGSRSSTGSVAHQRLKQGLIVCELALALALVGITVAFGVGAKAFIHRNVGWSVDGVFTGFLSLPHDPYGDNARSRQFHQALLPKLAVIPGVQHAALCTSVPIGSLGGSAAISIEGQPVEEPTRRPLTAVGIVTSGYFAALQIPLKQGAVFSATLTEKDPAVAVINESFAHRFWPGQNPIGRRVRLGDDEPWLEIVGVVGDIGMLGNLSTPPTPLQLFRPLVQAPNRGFSIVLRAAVAPEMLTKSVREAVASLDPDAPVASPGSLKTAVEQGFNGFNLVVLNLGISAGMGLLIAAVGLFGVISQLIAQRTRDIGVRIALGAQARDIVRLILGEGAKLLVVGIVLGALGYLALTQIFRQQMPALELPGLWLLAANFSVLGAIMLLACYLPARRATRINPVEALRAE